MLEIAVYQSVAANSLEAINYIEAVLGASRGPLAALSHQNVTGYKTKAKALRCLTNLVRMTHEACAIMNHAGDSSYSLGTRGAWIAFDAVNFYTNLSPQNVQSDDDVIELSARDKKTIDRLISSSQLFLLPALESITSVYQALAIEQTAQAQSNRRQAQAFCSLARATSIFLNNRKSKAAIVLLLAAISEAMLAVGRKIELSLTLDDQNQEQNLAQGQNDANAQIIEPTDEASEREIQASREEQHQEIVQLNTEPAQPDEHNARDETQEIQVDDQTTEQHNRELAATKEEQRRVQIAQELEMAHKELLFALEKAEIARNDCANLNREMDQLLAEEKELDDLLSQDS